jgi:predicted ribosomally synthesized peptide with SipW-like signal peptide
MIERKFIPLVVAVFVLTAGLSGSATVAVLSDSETVNVQISPDNVTASVVDNASAPAEENVTTTGTQNETEQLTVDDVDGLIVELEPADKTTNPGKTAKYDVVVKGATENITGYDVTLELSNTSVASFESFEHERRDEGGDFSITNSGARINASNGFSTPIPGQTELTLGTVNVSGKNVGTTSIEPIDEDPHSLNVHYINNDTYQFYNISAMYGSDLTVTENES